MRKFYYLVAMAIGIQVFLFLTSSIDHPFEDYFFVIVSGLLIVGVGKLCQLIFKLIKKAIKKK